MIKQDKNYKDWFKFKIYFILGILQLTLVETNEFLDQINAFLSFLSQYIKFRLNLLRTKNLLEKAGKNAHYKCLSLCIEKSRVKVKGPIFH